MELMGIDVNGEIYEGFFLFRKNRFEASVLVNGEVHIAHVPNTGRMAELLIEGARIIVRKSYSITRKTGYDLLMVYKGNILTCIDSRLPNDLVYNEIKDRSIREFSDYVDLKREVRYKNSRYDIYMSNGYKRNLIEVKCVTLFENKVARFPDAPTDRGRKHIKELIDAMKNNINGSVVFIIFSEDAEFFRPNDEMDPGFGRVLREAYINGLSIHAYSCSISPRRLELKKRLYLLI